MSHFFPLSGSLSLIFSSLYKAFSKNVDDDKDNIIKKRLLISAEKTVENVVFQGVRNKSMV